VVLDADAAEIPMPARSLPRTTVDETKHRSFLYQGGIVDFGLPWNSGRVGHRKKSRKIDFYAMVRMGGQDNTGQDGKTHP